MVEKNNYQLGFFSGQNNVGNIIIFALAITSSIRKDDYNILITSFVKLMDGKAPQTIVSDQDISLISCI